jgi:hypothetical protein
MLDFEAAAIVESFFFAVCIELLLLHPFSDVVKKKFGHTTQFIGRQESRRLMMDINAF